MKALFLANLPFDSMSTGGVQAAVQSLCEGLAYFTEEHEISVVSISKNMQSDSVVVQHGITYYFVQSVHTWYQRPSTLWNIPRVQKLIQQLQPNVVNVIDHPTMALAALNVNVPKVFTIHGIKKKEAQFWQGAEYWSHQYESIIESYIHTQYDNFIAVSPYVVELLGNKFGECKKVFKIPNAVSEHFFARQLDKKQDNEIIILNIGAYTRLKSQHILIKTILELQKEMTLRCIFCGPVDDPKYFGYLQSIIANNKTIELRQAVSREEIKRLLGRSSALVHTSKQENSPMIFLEAMAMKVPIVSSNVGGVSYLLDHDRLGTTYEYENTEHLINILHQFAVEREYFRRKADAAYDYVLQNHHPRIVAEKTLHAMGSLIS